MSISVGGLDGKTALVTGAGGGSGGAIGLGLAEAGARVVLLARSEGELDQVAGQVPVHGGRALVIPVDIGDPVSSLRPSSGPAPRSARWTCWSTTRRSWGRWEPARASIRPSGLPRSA